MKNRVFVDTVAWLALVNRSETLHDSARTVKNRLVQQKATLVTTDYVVVEIANALSRLPFRTLACSLIDLIHSSHDIELISITPELFEEAYLLYCARKDKEWGLTDCTSFVVMRIKGIHQAFTADRHFEQAGFSLLL